MAKRKHDDSEPDLTPKPAPKRAPARQSKHTKPRVHSPSPSPNDTKPDLDSDADMNVKPTKKRKAAGTGGGAAARKWTTAEYTALLHHALPKVPMKAWEGVLVDRTALQCDRAWNRRVVPKLLKMLREEGDKGE